MRLPDVPADGSVLWIMRFASCTLVVEAVCNLDRWEATSHDVVESVERGLIAITCYVFWSHGYTKGHLGSWKM